jgi:phage terminase large subunit GpA-like protein
MRPPTGTTPGQYPTPPVAALFTPRAWDLQAEQIRLINGFLLHLMWAGSPAATSSDPMRRVINDEVDKPGFRDWGGLEPNPIGRTWTRLRTFGDRKLQANISTPTTRFGNIFRLVEGSSVVLEFRCPCPLCGFAQVLTFRQLKWDGPKHQELSKRERVALADRIVAHNAVWYQCVQCGERIAPGHKPAMVRAGRWASTDGSVEDAEAVEEWPRGTRLGMRVPGMACLWESWASIAAEFILAAGDRGKLYTFRTETLGEVWEEQLEKPRASAYSAKCGRAELPAGTVPAWAAKVLATVDTQHDHFYVVLRAWGPDMQSQRVWHGRAESFDELDTVCFRHVWPVEGDGEAGARPELVLIDSGGTRLEGEAASRTMEVYRWAVRRGSRVRPIKGAGAAKRRREGVYIWPGKGFLDEGRRSRKGKRDGLEVRIWYLDTHHFADLLADLVARGAGEDADEAEAWLLNGEDDEEYNAQMANVHKVVMQDGGELVERWVPVESGAADHYWDCEVYQVAAAYMARVHLLPSAEELAEFQQVAADDERERRRVRGRRQDVEGGPGWEVRDMSKYLR